MIWETAFRLFASEDSVFPSPLQVGKAFWEGLTEQNLLEILKAVWHGDWDALKSKSFIVGAGASIVRGAYGFVLASAIGISVGLLMSLSDWVEWLVSPLVLGIQSLPSICWLPVAILWFGLNNNAILFVVLMGSVGSITIATRDGLRQIPRTYSRVAQTFGASTLQRLFMVNVPSAIPTFVTGLKQGWSFAWRSLLAGELIRDVLGVGGLISKSRDLQDYPRMFAAMILVLAISVLVDKVFFNKLEERVRARWVL